jgi:hypothetical protein
LQPRSPEALAADLVALLAGLPDRARVLLDGIGADLLADALVPGLTALGRPPVRVRGADFQRPAGERFMHGREDVEAFRDGWTDTGALAREVLRSGDTFLPALRDPVTDRSSRAARQPVPARGLVLVDGVFLLGLGLPADLVVHVALSPAALARRGVPAWQLPAFTSYDELVRPGDVCDVLVRAEDPLRPAVRLPGA